MVKYRTTASAALLAVLGAMFASLPASAAATTPAVRLAGELVLVADQQGPGLAAIRLADNSLVPITAERVKDIASGSAVTLDVAIPADVRVAAAANRTLTTQGVDGKEIAVRLRSSDLAAASDGSPEPLTSAIGKATVAEAMAPGTPALMVSKVVAAAADPVSTYTPATRRLYVAVVTPAGATPQPTVDESRIRAQVDGASSYWSDVTGGALTLSVATIAAQYTSAFTCSDDLKMWNEAAAKVGFTSAPNTSLVLELPKSVLASCGYGRGTIGRSPNNWGFLYVADDKWPVLAHELGHNMSMQHANALLCPAAADSAYSASGWTGTDCEEDGYGDGQDLMSASRADFAPFLSAPQSLRTGIIAPNEATVIDTSGTQSVTLLPLAGRTGVRAAEVVNPNTGVTYYVEYRTAAGRDLQNVFDGVQTGVRVLRYNPATGATVLLDPSPSGQFHDRDPTLPAGQTFTSYDGAVRITTRSANSASAVVSITNGTSPVTAPGAPTAVTATAGDGSATVSWAAPTSDGGDPVTGYTVSAAPGGRTATTAGATIVTVNGLTNGTAYTFTVTATNAALGAGPPSGPSGAVTPKDRVAPSVSLTGKPAAVTKSATAQFRFAGTDSSDPATSLRYLCSLDGRAATACASAATYSGLSSATHTFTVRAVDPAGNSSRPAVFTWRVDRQAPTAAMTAPAKPYSLSTSLTPAWSTRDVGGGIANVDVRYQRARYNGAFAAAVYPKGWQHTTAARRTMTRATPGYTYCFSTRARDKAGNVSAWSPPRCTSVALDDRAVSASSGWSRTTGRAYYAGTVTATTRNGVTLTGTGVQTKAIYLVATRCPTCGTVGVYWNGKRIRTISLYSARRTNRTVIGVTTFTSRRSGTLSIRSLTRSKPIHIDGVILPRR